MRLKRDVDSNVRGDVVAFDSCGITLTPRAGQVEVVCRLTTDVAITDMFLGHVG